MIFLSLPWLEIAEYSSIFLSLISLILFIALGKIFPFLFFVLVALLLNVVNRIRLEFRNRSRIAAALKIQQRKFSVDLEEIKQELKHQAEESQYIQPPNLLLTNVQLSDNVIIAKLQQDLKILEKSVNTVIEYFNKYQFQTRLQELEISRETLERQLNEMEGQIKANSPQITNVFPETSINRPLVDYTIAAPPNIFWKCTQIITAHEQSVTGLALSHDGQYLVTVSWDRTLKLWSLEQANLIDSVVASEQGLLAVSLIKSDSLASGLATGSFDQKIKIWSLVRAAKNQLKIQLEHAMTQHTGSVHGLAIASSKKILVSGSYDQTIKQWDLETGALIVSSYDELGEVNAVAVHEQGEFIASGGGEGTISIWEIGTGKLLQLLSGNLASVESVAITKSGQIVAGGCADGSVKLWYLPENAFESIQEIAPQIELQGHHGQVMALAFNPEGTILYTGGVDGFIKIWHCQTGQALGHLTISDENRIFSLALSDSGQILVAGGIDGTIKIWEQATSE